MRSYYAIICVDRTDIVWSRLFSLTTTKVIGTVLNLHRRLAPAFQNNMRQQIVSSIESPDGR
jgi:hypothetical protein